MIVLALEEFAAKRRGDQTDLEQSLFPFVSEAMDAYPVQGWYDDLLREVARAYLSVFHNEGGTGQPKPNARDFVADVRTALDKTESPDENTVARVSTWLSTAILNGATQAAAASDEEFLVMEWVTMHDSSVRPAHHDTEGQQRPPGVPFDVDGAPMRYPGDPLAPIGLWINCRCTLAPVLGSEAASIARKAMRRAVDSLDASVDTETSLVLVALPAEADPVHQIGDEDKHLTLIWLGKGSAADREKIGAAVADVADMVGEPFQVAVSGQGSLGPDHAKVWFVESPMVQAVHDVLLDDSEVAEAFELADQTHPHFVPHVTIGYGEDTPAEATDIESILFDRLAVWDGEARTEYPVGDAMTDTETEAPQQEAEPQEEQVMSQPVPWHGVLAPEGVWSGDKRRFAEGSLRFRDLPIPLTWQKASSEGHGGSVVVARIDEIERVGNMMQASGVFLATPEADEAVGLVAQFGRFGVSVDADDAEFDFDEETSEITFTSARIASASMVSIPAFAEAFIALGGWSDGEPAVEAVPLDPAMMPDDTECDPDAPDYEECLARQKEAPAAAGVMFVSDKPWSDFTAADYTDQQWKSACCLHVADTMNKSDHKLPIKEPGGALNRNGVHAAAARFNQVQAPAPAKAAAKRTLRGAYGTLGEDPPDVLKAAVILPEQFKRGPGWVTNPVATKRLHDYWTVPGHEGYAKIGWGVPGDFDRCRAEVGSEIAENSPDKTRFLNQICAQWHHDALGYWPGRPTSGDTRQFEGDPAPALTLLASGGFCAPSEWFQDPVLPELTPLTVTEKGRVFGHLAGWSTCHIGYEDMCVSPPHSASNYAYFRTGSVMTDAGMVPVGNITIGGGHASPGLRPKAALAHYDSTSTAVCDVAAGEDEYGIWLAGWVRPGTSDEQVAALRASGPSGDWRRIGGEMELIAALAVNVQGFPVPRVGVQDAVQVALVAAGTVERPEPVAALDMDALAAEVERNIMARQDRRNQMAALAARVGG